MLSYLILLNDGSVKVRGGSHCYWFVCSASAALMLPHAPDAFIESQLFLRAAHAASITAAAPQAKPPITARIFDQRLLDLEVALSF